MGDACAQHCNCWSVFFIWPRYSSSRSYPWCWHCLYFNVCTPLADIPGRSRLRAADCGDLLYSAINWNEDWWSKFLHCSTHSVEIIGAIKLSAKCNLHQGWNAHLFNLAYKRHVSSEKYLGVNLINYLLIYKYKQFDRITSSITDNTCET